jgi:Uma2 family endonuclease
MASKTLITCENYVTLEEPQGMKYELSEGDLIVTPSASFFHNKIGYYLVATMGAFAESQGLGDVIGETDVRLIGETVRRPDAAFFRAGHLRGIDLDRVPLPVVPDLVIEIVSRTDSAGDLIVKVQQYLVAGAKAVWLLYPNSRLAYRYLPDRPEPQVLTAAAHHRLEEPELLPGFSLPIEQIFALAVTQDSL